jgi:hypothetical protein
MEETEIENPLYAIIRKPQEGKTFICIENLKLHNDYIHIIVTMNTIKSNNQFFNRVKTVFNNNVCILNSKTYNDINIKNSKNVSDIIDYIDYENRNIVIMCAHKKRLTISIPELLKRIDNSRRSYNKKVIIHIDEAHEYIPANRNEIYNIHNNNLVEQIYLYSATPINILINKSTNNKVNKLFENMYVVDCEEQFNVMRTKKYYGVKNCKILEIKNNTKDIDIKIPDSIRKHLKKAPCDYYGESYLFTLGNEIKFLSWINYMLTYLKENKIISNNVFSYNFIPGFIRKITHITIMTYILNIFDKANVLIINGDGSILYNKKNNKLNIKILEEDYEITTLINKIKKQNPNNPLFITGLQCVSMSVTFIDEKIGNFDNVLFGQIHYQNHPAILYQLCRFLFNYHNWKDCSKIKKTNLFVCDRIISNICLEYEKQIDLIVSNHKGTIIDKETLSGNIKVKQPRLLKEKKYEPLTKYVVSHKLKIFYVSEDDNHKEKLKEVIDYCNKFLEKDNKKLQKKSIPIKSNKNNGYFYECSITKNKDIQVGFSEKKKIINNMSWHSNFQLVKNYFRYCRIYVIYDEKSNPNDYAFIIKKLELKNTEDSRNLLSSILKK